MKIVALNVASASERRAEAIIEWLRMSEADLVVFSETSDGPGTKRIANSFADLGWYGELGESRGRERGAAIYARLPVEAIARPARDPLPARAIAVSVDGFDVYGFYIPNRGRDPEKLERKASFLDAWGDWLESRGREYGSLVIGDLNVVPSTQRPIMLPQMKFEYDWLERLQRTYADLALRHLGVHEHTWIAHTGEGYTYDHALASQSLLPRIAGFHYDHSSRTSAASDHSALTVVVTSSKAPEARPISELARWQAQAELF